MGSREEKERHESECDRANNFDAKTFVKAPKYFKPNVKIYMRGF
jgi:hypothetical protein